MAKVELKQPIVQEIAAQIDGAQSVVVVDYRGLTVSEDTQLRKELREAGVSYKVYKNTLMNFAFKGTEFEALAPVLEGPNAIAISKEDAKLTKKQYKAKLAKRKHSTVGYELASQIEKATGLEVRVTIPGHTQRGGSPVPFDRVISSRLGVAAAELIAKEDYGKMLIMKGYDVATLPLEKTAGKLKYVSPDDQIVLQAKHLGISFGD